MHIILHSKYSWTGHGIVLLLPVLRQLAPHSRKTRQIQTCIFRRATRENGEIIPHPTKSSRDEQNPAVQWRVLLLPVCWRTKGLEDFSHHRLQRSRYKGESLSQHSESTKKRGSLWGNTNTSVPPRVPPPWELCVRTREQELRAALLWAGRGCQCDRDRAPRVWGAGVELTGTWRLTWAEPGPRVRGRRSDLPRGVPCWNFTSIDSRENKWLIVYQHTDLFGLPLPAALPGM